MTQSSGDALDARLHEQDENARSNPMPEVLGGTASFNEDADYVAAPADAPILVTELLEASERIIREEAVWRPDRAEDRSAAVHQAVGAASVCWENMSHTGIFDEQQARAVAAGLLAWLDENEGSERERLREKIEPAQYELLMNPPKPHARWHQADDGTYFSVHGPITVVVERAHPADLPFIHVIGRMQDINPGAARWLSLRLAEATAIVETAVIP